MYCVEKQVCVCVCVCVCGKIEFHIPLLSVKEMIANRVPCFHHQCIVTS